MLVILKLPILYLIGVVWWAVRAEPRPYEHAALVPAVPHDGEPEPCPWRRPSRRPHGPVRGKRRATVWAA
jgi:hypothetical protein